MSKLKIRIAAGATVIGLGGLAGLALGSGQRQQAVTVADKPAVRTKVIRRTIHVTKHAKPKHPAATGSGGGAAAASSSSAGSGSVTTGSSSAGSYSSSESTPVTTSTSGASEGASSSPEPVVTGTSGASAGSGSGGGYEQEFESDDGGGEYEGGADD